MPAVEHRGAEWYVELARRATAEAMDGIASGAGDDVAADLSLAAAAWDVVMGVGTNDERASVNEYVLTDDDGYEVAPLCICPPDLLARGGFRGGCPVHG